MNDFINIWTAPFREMNLSTREKLAIAVGAPAAYVIVCILASLLP